MSRLLRATSYWLLLLWACFAPLFPATAQAEQEGRVQILLLGDSTTIGSICRLVEPDAPHLEDIIRLLLATDPALPPVDVINQGRNGEYIHGLLSSGRYDRDIASLAGIDYVFVRYGLNDLRKREDFDTNFPADYRALVARLKSDFPQATIIATTTIPYFTPEEDARILAHVRHVAHSEQLPLFDLHARYQQELAAGANMLNYRRLPLTAIPQEHRQWVQPFVVGESVIVMDNRLDAHFSQVPGWFADRHPNLAGYHVIGDATAGYLAPLLKK